MTMWQGPMFVLMIFQPEGEPKIIFERTTRHCKESLERKGIGKAAVIFIVSQVGSSDTATKFLKNLEKKPDIQHMIYCSDEKLDKILSDQGFPEKVSACQVS